MLATIQHQFISQDIVSLLLIVINNIYKIKDKTTTMKKKPQEVIYSKLTWDA